MLKKKELLTRDVEVDGVKYIVSAMTVHKRTAFEVAMAEHGSGYTREALLAFCVETADHQPAFSAESFRVGEGDAAEAKALSALFDALASYPYTQLEPLVLVCMEVNDLLGNVSSPN
jgi:hypothetical protein